MTARIIFFSLTLICLALGQPVHAQPASKPSNQACSPDLTNIAGSSMQIADFSYGNGGVIVSDACKVWPKDNAITLLAIAYLGKAEDAVILAVAMIDNGSNKVIASYRDVLGRQAAMHITRNSLNIDTARYDVARGIRAFGVDITAGNIPDCGASGLGRSRNLYVLDGNEIKPILEGFYLSYWKLIDSEAASCPGSKKSGKTAEPLIETITLKITIGKSVTNGYSDLSIFSISSLADAYKDIREPFHYELKYDGEKYPVHEMNAKFLHWLR